MASIQIPFSGRLTMLDFFRAAVFLPLLLPTATATASYESIAGYMPTTDVSDHAQIDLDQASIEDYLDGGSQEAFANARNVYEMGAFSKSIATITLDEPSTGEFSKGTVFTGTDIAGLNISLSAHTDMRPGDTQLQLQYLSRGCYVGGLVGPQNTGGENFTDLTDSVDQIWDGCLSEAGMVWTDGGEFTYSYNIPTDNWNGRTIAQFSTTADTKMRPDQAAGAYFPDFQKFVDYYGPADYADAWITAALEGAATNFSRGNADFSIWSDNYGALDVAVKKGSSHMAVAMYVIRELEDALYDCEQGCDDAECNEDLVNSLDEAVAFYAGSLEGTDGSGNGVLMYALAETRAADFRTAGPDGGETRGRSKVNHDIFKEFSLMQDALLERDCEAARTRKEKIVQIMTVPLIQSALRYAYFLDGDPEPRSRVVAQGAVSAAAVLPYIAYCSSDDAATIYENLRVGASDPTNFTVVKSAFENNYDCLGVACADIGGIFNRNDCTYEDGAGPCGGADTLWPSTLGCATADSSPSQQPQTGADVPDDNSSQSTGSSPLTERRYLPVTLASTTLTLLVAAWI